MLIFYSKTEDGIFIKGLVSKGEIVPTEITVKLLLKTIKSSSSKVKFNSSLISKFLLFFDKKNYFSYLMHDFLFCFNKKHVYLIDLHS